MNTCKFVGTRFDSKNTRSTFVYSKDSGRKPVHIYRIDPENFEIRNIDNTILLGVNCNEIDGDIHFKYANYFYLNDTLYFFVAAQSIDGLYSHVYLVNPLKKQPFHQLEFNRRIKGVVTNIFVSNALKNDSNKDEYHIVTIGTLDSAIYVFKLTAGMVLEKQTLACTLLRTDAKNSITQQLVVCGKTLSESPPDIYIVSGGSNGIMDFFFMKADSEVEKEPILKFVSHQLIKLPSKLPITAIECHTIADDKVLLAISQELLNPTRISRTIEPSVSIVKLDIQKMVGKDIKSIKFKSGTHIVPKDTMTKEPFQVWTCYSDKDNGQFMLTQCEFDSSKLEFGERTNHFLRQTVGETLGLQDVAILGNDSCWILDKQALHKLKSEDSQPKGHKRQRST